jgi:hypothetical protein
MTAGEAAIGAKRTLASAQYLAVGLSHTPQLLGALIGPIIRLICLNDGPVAALISGIIKMSMPINRAIGSRFLNISGVAELAANQDRQFQQA